MLRITYMCWCATKESRVRKRMQTLEELLSAFVEKECEGRPLSHNWDHMYDVTVDAMDIFDSMHDERRQSMRNITLIVAWIHDVPDHKYDKDGSLKEKCLKFLQETLKYNEDDANNIMEIVSLISFSKENKMQESTGRPVKWVSVLGARNAAIREVVSDADKLQAIGEIGIKRCAQYVRELAEENKEEVVMEDLCECIRIHANEKLLRLMPEFIRTDRGKELAKPKHEKMVAILEDLPAWLSKNATTEKK